MRLILCLSALLLFFTIPAFSELTVDDLEKINSIVEKNVKEAEQRLKEDIAATEQQLTKDISQETAKVYVKIEEMGKSLNYIFAMVIALVALIAVVIGIPQFIVAMQQKEQRTLGEKIEAQQKQIEALQQAIETRDQERIVRP